MDLIAANNDNNNDGLVTTQDIAIDLANNYDTDSEFCVCIRGEDTGRIAHAA